MNEQDLDLDNLDNLLEDFDGVTVEGGVDSENDDGCEGGACKPLKPSKNIKETTSWHTAIK